jgi:hypothetical protein
MEKTFVFPCTILKAKSISRHWAFVNAFAWPYDQEMLVIEPVDFSNPLFVATAQLVKTKLWPLNFAIISKVSKHASCAQGGSCMFLSLPARLLPSKYWSIFCFRIKAANRNNSRYGREANQGPAGLYTGLAIGWSRTPTVRNNLNARFSLSRLHKGESRKKGLLDQNKTHVQ